MEIDFVNAIQEKSVSQLIQLIQGVESSKLEDIISRLSTFPVIGGSSLMHWAAELHSLELAKIVISKKVYKDINLKDDGGASCLHWACGEGMVDVALLYLENGANLNAEDFNGETPSHWAALNGHSSCIELLADKGANLNKQADNGATPLHLATINKHGNCVGILLDKGADSEIKDKSGKTPKQIAESKNLMNIIDYFSSDKRKSFEKISVLENEIVRLKNELYLSKQQNQKVKEELESTSLRMSTIFKEKISLEELTKSLKEQLTNMQEEMENQKRVKGKLELMLQEVIHENKRVESKNSELEKDLETMRQQEKISNSVNIVNPGSTISYKEPDVSIDSLTLFNLQSTLSNLQMQFINTMQALNSATTLVEDVNSKMQK